MHVGLGRWTHGRAQDEKHQRHEEQARMQGPQPHRPEPRVPPVSTLVEAAFVVDIVQVNVLEQGRVGLFREPSTQHEALLLLGMTVLFIRADDVRVLGGGVVVVHD